MTPDELRRLAEELDRVDALGDDVLYEVQADAIRLAPDLARLCADMGTWLGGNSMRHHEFVSDWLARLSELEAR